MDQQQQYKELYRKWLIQGGLGAVILGAGLSILLELAFMRYDGDDFWVWFGLATFALMLVMSGISLMGDSIRHRIKYLKIKDKDHNLPKND